MIKSKKMGIVLACSGLFVTTAAGCDIVQTKQAPAISSMVEVEPGTAPLTELDVAPEDFEFDDEDEREFVLRSLSDMGDSCRWQAAYAHGANVKMLNYHCSGDKHVVMGGCRLDANVADGTYLQRNHPYENGNVNDLPGNREDVDRTDGKTGWMCMTNQGLGDNHAHMYVNLLCCDF